MYIVATEYVDQTLTLCGVSGGCGWSLSILLGVADHFTYMVEKVNTFSKFGAALKVIRKLAHIWHILGIFRRALLCS